MDATESLENIRPNSIMDFWYFHRKNCPAHRAINYTAHLTTTNLKLLKHPCSLAPFRTCIPYMKMKMKERRFSKESLNEM